MDFERIGQDVSEEEKLKSEFSNTYLLRCFLLEKYNENDKLLIQSRKGNVSSCAKTWF
jgi:hypothetical protein